MPRFTVICDWKDGRTEDSDEVVVTAKTAAGAASRGRKKWAETVPWARFPGCRLTKVWVLTKARAKASAHVW